MSRTITPAPTDRSMWRQLLRRCHPDHGGEHELFVWVSALHEHVAGDAPEYERTGYQRRQPPQRSYPTGGGSDRLDFTDAYQYESFADLTAHAVGLADSVPDRYAALLRLLRSCYPASESDTTLWRAQHSGASYKQLAFIAHLSDMDAGQRRHWYRLAESIPLAQRHAGHIIRELQARAA